MERYDVELLPAAYLDLDEIFDYIMADNPQAASRILDSIMRGLCAVLRIIHILEHPYSSVLLKSSISE